MPGMTAVGRWVAFFFLATIVILACLYVSQDDFDDEDFAVFESPDAEVVAEPVTIQHAAASMRAVTSPAKTDRSRSPPRLSDPSLRAPPA